MSRAVKTGPKGKGRFKEADYDDRSHMMAGDHYGSGVKAKVGKMRGDSVGYIPVTKKKLRKPPKAVA